MKTPVITFLGVDFVAIPQIKTEGEACEGCVFETEPGFDCGAVNPTCHIDDSIYVLNEESVARMVAKKLSSKQERS